MMRERVEISVVICAYSERRWDRLCAAVESVQRQDMPAFEVLVIIDHNPDLERRFSAAYPKVRTLSNDGRRGLSGARNAGIRAARGAVVAFLDDDAVATTTWLSLMAVHYSNPATIGVGGRVEPIWPGGRPGWFPEEFGWVVGCSYRGQPEAVAPVRNFIGCNMSFRRTLFEQIGGFKEEMGREGSNGSGCEETEFCIRAHQAYPQLALLYDPRMVVYHHLEAERATWQYFRMRCRAEGRSKALVAYHRGASDALSAERRYTTRILPSGFIHGLGDAVARFDISGLGRAAAILAGFTTTAAAYAAARYAAKPQQVAPRSYQPIQVLDLELRTAAPPRVRRITDTSTRYHSAFCLVRSEGRPIGTAEVPLDRNGGLPQGLESFARVPSPGHRDIDAIPTPDVFPFISVIIATRDRPAQLDACLASVLQQEYRSFEVIVVDNAPSSEDTATLIDTRYASTGRVRYVRENIPGLGRAHNRGLANAVAPIAAFTDDDVIVDRKWLTAIAANFAADNRIACVTGLILPAELETRAQYWAEHHGGFGKGFERKLYDLGLNRPPGRLFPFTAGQLGSGANMAFRTDVLRKLGGFDSALGAGTPARGGDDLASFFATLAAGYQLVYEPEAVVWHYHRREEAGMRRQAFGYGVGLGAYLAKLIADRPSRMVDLAIATPAAFRHLFGRASPKNARLADDYPRSFVWRERLGILAGIPLYFISRTAARRPAQRSRKSGPASLSPAAD
jgi:O-antigen biosynthesis protein